LSAQTVQIGGGLGLAVPEGDYGGTTRDYYNGTAYGLANGLDVYLKGRFGFAPVLIAAEINYASFSNSGNSESDKGAVVISQNILALRVGPEFALGVPAAPVTGYVGVMLGLNSIAGHTSFQGVADVPSGDFDVTTTIRFGLGIDGGVLVKLAPFVNLDISADYNAINLFGRTWDPVSRDNLLNKRIDSYLALHDDADPKFDNSTDHFIGSPRAIQTLEVRLGLMVGI
jgi:hypothetical protein